MHLIPRISAASMVLLTTAAFTAATTTAPSTKPKPSRGNTDESKVGMYTLVDPLTTCSGKKITTPDDWFNLRRPEIIKLFEDNQFGRCPPKPSDEKFLTFDNNQQALDGKAIRKQIMITFAKPDGPKLHMLLYLPPTSAQSPVPVFLCLNYSGVHEIISDPGITLTPVWDRRKKTISLPPESSRGSSNSWPVETILARGYGFAIIYYDDIEPDFQDGLQYGVRAMYMKPGQTDVAPDEWGAIAAWGWGLSRAQDYLETDPQVDSKHTVLMGHSRVGKCVLWAAARDTRFAAVIASCSGKGAGSLTGRDFGETIKDLNKNFAWQFAGNYQKFGGHDQELPVDAHLLISLIAPRPVFLSTGSLDLHSDPKGEFLAEVAAAPVYQLLGAQPLGTDQFPPYDTPIMHDLAYQCHTGAHQVLLSDWDQFLNFADLHFKKFTSPATTQ